MHNRLSRDFNRANRNAFSGCSASASRLILAFDERELPVKVQPFSPYRIYRETVENAGDGTVRLEGFNPDEDILRLDDVSDTIETEELLDQEGVTVNENPLDDSSDYTSIGFGSEEDGQAGLLELIGILDGDLSETPYEVV